MLDYALKTCGETIPSDDFLLRNQKEIQHIIDNKTQYCVCDKTIEKLTCIIKDYQERVLRKEQEKRRGGFSFWDMLPSPGSWQSGAKEESDNKRLSRNKNNGAC